MVNRGVSPSTVKGIREPHEVKKKSFDVGGYLLVQLTLKDVRAHCYCASLVRTLFIGHARATSFLSARTESKT